MGAQDTLTFFVNGKKVTDGNPNPEDSLLQYLRRKLLLPGTKEGCGHGGCGSCTVMVSKYDCFSKTIHYNVNACLFPVCAAHGLAITTVEGVGDPNTGLHAVQVCRIYYYYNVNACLFPVCAAHGLAITTVEGVGDPNTGLHAVQKSLVEKHGLQCGFCTPGFVMTAFTLLRNNPKPSRDEVEMAIEGNLCRCTGYRGILDALDVFTKEGCPMGDACCRNNAGQKSPPADNHIAKEEDNTKDTQVPIFPSELQLNSEYQTATVTFKGKNWTWIRPTSLKELLTLKNEYEQAPIIMGNTTTALHIKLGKFNESPVLLYGGSIPELKKVTVTKSGVSFGAALTLNELKTQVNLLREQSQGKADKKYGYVDCILEMVRYYGADQIRNVATLSGSLMSGRSNSDISTLLLALDARTTVKSVDGERSVSMENLSVNGNEVITSIYLPDNLEGSFCRFYKQSDRRTFSLAIINSGMFVSFSEDHLITNLRLCFGGVTERPFIARKCSSAAVGRKWNQDLLEDIKAMLAEELHHDKDHDNYKASVGTAFFYRFFTEIDAALNDRTDSSSLLTPVPLPPVSGAMYFDPCTDPAQSDQDALGRPIPNVSSEAIVSGEAMYIDDMPKLDGELFMSMVLSKRAHATIISVDPDKALQMEGVHGFIDYRDIPGENKWGNIEQDEEMFASTKVVCVGQFIGGVLAETRELARKAANLVQVKYEDLQPILTIEDAIAAESYIGEPVTQLWGDVEKGFSESDHIMTGEYGVGAQEHFYMEPFGALVIPKIENNEMDVYVTSQYILGVQEAICAALKLPQNKITCKVRRVGGSFGGKDVRNPIISAPAAVAALKYKRPIRCILPRDTDMAVTGKRHPFLGRYKVGFDKTGCIKSLDLKLYNNAGISMDNSYEVMKHAVWRYNNCIKLDNVRVEGRVCKTNIPSNTSCRAFGGPEAILVFEDLLFHIACFLKLRPEQVIQQNLYNEGDSTPYGKKLDNCTARALWAQCADQSNYAQRLQDIEEFNRINRWKKRGLAMTAIRFGVGVPCVFLHRGTAVVNIYKDGSVLLTHGGIEMGQGLNTKMIQIAPRELGIAVSKIYTNETGTHTIHNLFITIRNTTTILSQIQIASRELGIPVSKIYTNETGTHTIADPMFTGGSFGTENFGPAVYDACRILNKRLGPVKSEFPDCTWEEMIEKAFFKRVKLQATGFSRKEVEADPNNGLNSKYPYDHYTYGAICTEVEIDILTGENQVLQADLVCDIGKSINPGIDISQIEGAFVQGMGMVTSESVDTDETGRITNCSPLSYKIPNVRSIPRKFNVTLMKNRGYVNTSYSAKGVGEPPLLLSMSVIQAIKMAVLAARSQIGLTGYFRLDSPATVQRIKEACSDQLIWATKA